MKGAVAGTLVACVVMGLVAGCEQPKPEEPVAQAPPAETLPPFPEEQVPAPEPQPAVETASPPAPAPPVDTAATSAEPKPAATAQPLPKENYAPEPKPARTYVVKKGDTLQKISKRFYGTTRKWRSIYEANRDVLKKGPDQLQLGMKLKIP